MEKKQLEAAPTIDLSERKSDAMVVILWWVKDTLETYVTVDDTAKTGNYHVIPTPPGVSANDVFYHPFAYPEMAPPQLEAA
jgi:hypothetical protein